MNHWFKRLGRDALIYGIGGLLARGIAVFLLPIYTRLFSPTDYGQIEMMNAVVGFMGALIGLGMDSAQSFYFTQKASEGETKQAEIVSAIFQWRIIYGLFILFLCCACIPWINREFFANSIAWHLFFISFFTSYTGQFLSQTNEIQRLLFNVQNYILVNLGNSILGILLGLFFVIRWKMGIAGFFWASFCSTLVFAAYSCWRTKKYLIFTRLHINWWPKLLQFGAPFLPEALAMYVMNTANRWFLVHYHGQEALGIYSVGLRFSLLMVLAVTTFRQAFMPAALEAMNHEDGPKLFEKVAYLAGSLGMAAVIFMTATSKLWLFIFTSPAYHSAFPIVGILSWQSFLYGFYLIASVGIWKSEKTYLAPFNLGIAALINLLFCWYLIPPMGIIGAAIANAIGFLVWNILAIYWSERTWVVVFPKWHLLHQSLVGILGIWIITHQLIANYSQIVITLETLALISYFVFNSAQILLKKKPTF